MRQFAVSGMVVCIILMLAACGKTIRDDSQIEVGSEKNQESQVETEEMYTRKTKIADVINDKAFGDYGRLIFPVDTGYYSGGYFGESKADVVQQYGSGYNG